METIVLSSRIWISKTVYTYILHMILRSTRTIINEKCLNGGAMSAWPWPQAIEKNSTHAGKAGRKALSGDGGQNKGTSSAGPN